MIDCGERLGLAPHSFEHLVPVIARPGRVHGKVHCAKNQLSRVADLDRDDAVGLQVGRGENSRKSSLAEAAVDAITPVDCQVDQFIEIRLVGLSAMRTKDGERRKLSRTARAQIHNSTPTGRKVGGVGISNKKGRQSIGDKETRRQGDKETGKLLITETTSST